MNCWYNDVQRVFIQHVFGVRKSPWSLTLQMILSRAFFSMKTSDLWLIFSWVLLYEVLWMILIRCGIDLDNGLVPNIVLYRKKWMSVIRRMHASLGQNCKKHNPGWGVLNLHSLISPQGKSLLNHWISFIFNRCHHSSAVVTPVKYKRDIQH